DFGLAKTAAAPVTGTGGSVLPTEPAPMTAAGAILGTFQYMAPEQVEGKEADARSDLFALGAVIYEMATGKKAFEGGSQASLIAARLDREPPPMSSLQPLTPKLLERVVRQCLAKAPEQRWQSARDLATELKWIADGASDVEVRRAAGPASPAREAIVRAAFLMAGALAAGTAGGVVAAARPRAARARLPAGDSGAPRLAHQPSPLPPPAA